MSEEKEDQTAAVAPIAPSPTMQKPPLEESTAGASESIALDSRNLAHGGAQKRADEDIRKVETPAAPVFQAEVAPLQAVFLNDQQIYIFRRIMFDGQIYRQGFVLKVRPFLNYLTASICNANAKTLYS
jgi:hypothetical protein